jgi:hypothetical protein
MMMMMMSLTCCELLIGVEQPCIHNMSSESDKGVRRMDQVRER